MATYNSLLVALFSHMLNGQNKLHGTKFDSHRLILLTRKNEKGSQNFEVLTFQIYLKSHCSKI